MHEGRENILQIGDSGKMPLSWIGDAGRISVPAGQPREFGSVRMSRAL